MNCFHLSKSSFNFGFTNSSITILKHIMCVVNCFHLSKSSFNFGFTNSRLPCFGCPFRLWIAFIYQKVLLILDSQTASVLPLRLPWPVVNCFHLSKSSFNFGFTNSTIFQFCFCHCVVNCFHLSKSSFNFGFTNSESKSEDNSIFVVNCFHLSKSSFNFGFTNSRWQVSASN